MNNSIEWSSDDDSNNKNNPWQNPKKSNFEDLILKEEYRSRRLRFEPGMTWMRILPAFKTSPFAWMLGVHALSFESGHFAHPKTLHPNARSVWDHCYGWAKENHPQALYSKANKQGIRLLTDPVCVFWALVEQNGTYVARLFQGSGYDASRGGAPGLGHQILKLTQEVDERDNLVAEPVHPERGVLIGVEKTKTTGSQYPSYALRVGRQPAPMADVLGKTSDEEIEVLRPLEKVIRAVSDEEEWHFLAKVLSPDHLAAFRESLNRKAA